jgi:hypothetical protein
MARKDCKIGRAYIERDEEVSFREKKVQELVCCFRLYQLLSFKILVMRFMIRWLTQIYCVRDLQ